MPDLPDNMMGTGQQTQIQQIYIFLFPVFCAMDECLWSITILRYLCHTLLLPVGTQKLPLGGMNDGGNHIPQKTDILHLSIEQKCGPRIVLQEYPLNKLTPNDYSGNNNRER